jgi:hypothetical protein
MSAAWLLHLGRHRLKRIAPKIEVEVLLDLFLLNVFDLNIGCLNSSIFILRPSAQLNQQASAPIGSMIFN